MFAHDVASAQPTILWKLEQFNDKLAIAVLEADRPATKHRQRVRLVVWFRRACGRRVCDFDVSRRHSVGVSPDGVPRLSGLVESPSHCEESVFATQMYDDGDLSLTLTSLVDVPVPSTHAASCSQESNLKEGKADRAVVFHDMCVEEVLLNDEKKAAKWGRLV